MNTKIVEKKQVRSGIRALTYLTLCEMYSTGLLQSNANRYEMCDKVIKRNFEGWSLPYKLFDAACNKLSDNLSKQAKVA